MLILTRKEGEAVWIGNDIRISVEYIDGRQVRLGFDAPREVRIVREELLTRDTWEYEEERRDV